MRVVPFVDGAGRREDDLMQPRVRRRPRARVKTLRPLARLIGALATGGTPRELIPSPRPQAAARRIAPRKPPTRAGGASHVVRPRGLPLRMPRIDGATE